MYALIITILFSWALPWAHQPFPTISVTPPCTVGLDIYWEEWSFPMIFPQWRESALFVPSYLWTKSLLLRVKSEGRRAGEAEPSYTPIALLAQDKKAFIFFWQNKVHLFQTPSASCWSCTSWTLKLKKQTTTTTKLTATITRKPHILQEGVHFEFQVLEDLLALK